MLLSPCVRKDKVHNLSRRMTKPTKWPVCPAKTPISLGICPVYSVFAVCMKKPCVLTYPLSAQRWLWSDWGGCPGWSKSLLSAHAILLFCFVMLWLISVTERRNQYHGRFFFQEAHPNIKHFHMMTFLNYDCSQLDSLKGYQTSHKQKQIMNIVNRQCHKIFHDQTLQKEQSDQGLHCLLLHLHYPVGNSQTCQSIFASG